MDETKLRNDVSEILSSIKELWKTKEKQNEENDVYVSLPVFLQESKENTKPTALYQIFKKVDETDNLQMISVVEVNLLSGDIIRSCNTKLYKSDTRVVSDFNYTRDVFLECEKSFIEIFYFCITLKKFVGDNQEYANKLNFLYEKIKEYEKHDEIVKIYDNYKTYATSNEVNLFENIEKIDYDFEFNDAFGLNYMSDKTLEIAFEFIRHGNIKLSLEGKSLKIASDIISFCDYKTTTDDLYNIVKGNKKLEDKDIYANYDSVNTVNDYTSYSENICYNCKFEKCPKRIAGYILWLYSKNLLKNKLIEREEFRREKKINDNFNFTWNNPDGLKKVDDETYNFAEKLLENNLIWVDNVLSNNYIYISSKLSCDMYKIANMNLDFLDDEALKNRRYTVMKRDINASLNFCNPFSCRLNMCPYIVAGYLFYLKRCGYEEQIIEDRKYYHENKDEVDKYLQNKKNEKIESLKNTRQEKTQVLREYENSVENLSNLTDEITSKTQSNIHCIIDCDDSVESENFIKIIKELIRKEKGISENDVRYESLQHFMAGSAYYWSGVKYNDCKQDENGIVLKNAKGEPIFKNDSMGNIYRYEDAIKYPEIQEKSIFILNGISEFVNDYREYSNDTKNQKRRKQITRAIEKLTDMISNSYIIITGTGKEVKSLLDIDSRIKFVYSNNIYKIPEMSIEEMFELYVSKIDEELINELRNNYDDYKEKFIEYISLNKPFVPFANREFVNYLLMYARMKDEVVFPPNIYKKETVEESLKNIIGLNTVKEKVKEFEKYMLFKVRAESNGLKIKDSNMHMIFTGNPGTGKTTIARIMAKMLFDLGIIKENKLVEVERKDLIGEYVGQTAPKTAEVIQKALGGVLFIDEAYSLTPKDNARDFGAEALATLIKAMEDHKDEFIVIFAGYKDEMKTFIDTNPGITSRVGYTFEFSDYTSEELLRMFKLKMTNSGFDIDSEVDDEVKSLCDYYSKKKSFGNGRFIDKLMQFTITKHAISTADENIKRIRLADIPTIEEMNNTTRKIDQGTLEEMTEDIIGMEELKKKLHELQTYAKFVKEASNKRLNIPSQNLHMVFTGNPGTGKTTIARIIAKMLFEIGIIHENKLVEVERKDLIGEYVGQTAPKTAAVIEKALGGVLFIDEAYSLTPKNGGRDFSDEAIATLIKAMEDQKDQLIVIFAGYKKEMKTFIEANSGIASRIGYTFDFPDYSAEELCQIFDKKIFKIGFTIDKGAEDKVLAIMKYFASVENIGNGRFVDKVLQETLVAHSKRISELYDSDTTIQISHLTEEDIPTVKEMTKYMFGGDNMIDVERITEDAQRRTAVHEVGHATLGLLLFDKPGIKKITISAEGTGTLGYVRYDLSNTDYTNSKTYKLNRIKRLLAGMASEQVYYGEFEDGNSSDLKMATGIAKDLVTKYGMSDLGYAQIDSIEGELAVLVQKEINKIMTRCFDDTVELIKKYKKNMDAVVEYLMKNKEINEEEFIKNFDIANCT